MVANSELEELYLYPHEYLIFIWIILVIIVIPFNWYLDGKYVKRKLSEPISKDTLIDEKPLIKHTNIIYDYSINDLFERIKKWIQENNGEILSETKPIEIEYIYPKGASVSGYRASILDALTKDFVKISLRDQPEYSVRLDVSFYPVEKVKFNSYRLDTKYRYFSLLEKLYKALDIIDDGSLLRKIYTIDVVKYRLDKRFRNMLVYCFIVFSGVVLLWSIDEAYASSLYLGSFIAVGKFFILVLGFGVPFIIWDYLADRKFYRTLTVTASTSHTVA